MDIQEIHRIWSAAPRGTKKEMIRQIAISIGVSQDTVYRELNKRFGKTKVVKRSLRIDQENVCIIEIAKMKIYGYGRMSGRELATDICIEILIDRGFPGADKLTVSTVNRRLRGLGFRDPEVIVRVESRYANQTHQIDFSRSEYFQVKKFDPVKGDYILKATTGHLKYKEDGTLLRTWYWGITDAFSRCSLAKMFVATGENIYMGVEGLNMAYTRQEDSHPMRHLPDKIKSDNGALIKNESFRQLLDKLGIDIELSKPYKKRGIQKREAAWKLLWQRFELKLYDQMKEGYEIYLEEFNELLHEFMIRMLDREHPIYKSETRGHMYKTSIQMREQRVVDKDMRILLNKPFTRTVNDDLTITINNQKYQAQDSHLIGQKVSCWINLNGDVVAETLSRACKPFLMTPTEGFVYEGDFYHRHSPNFRQKLETEVNKEKYPKKVNYLKPRERTIEVEDKFEEAIEGASQDFTFPNEFEAKKYIASQFGRNASYSDFSSIFDPLLTDTLRKSDIDLIIEGIQNKQVAL